MYRDMLQTVNALIVTIKFIGLDFSFNNVFLFTVNLYGVCSIKFSICCSIFETEHTGVFFWFLPLILVYEKDTQYCMQMRI